MSSPHVDEGPRSSNARRPSAAGGGSSAARLALPTVLSGPRATRRRGPLSGGLSAARLRHELGALTARGVQFVPFGLLHRAIEEGRSDAHRQAILAFADCDVRFLDEVWPILQEFAIPPLLFVRTAYVGQRVSSRFLARAERYLSWTDLAALRDRGGSIQSMGHHGVDLDQVAPEVAFGELVRSRRELENRLGLEPKAVLYRGGRGQGETLDLVRSAGFEVGFEQGAMPPYASPLAMGCVPLNRWGVPSRRWRNAANAASFVRVDAVVPPGGSPTV